jgi:hypothetical protein
LAYCCKRSHGVFHLGAPLWRDPVFFKNIRLG